MKKAFITGVSGQDGSYLSELLLNKGYEVHGLIRRLSTFNRERINHIYDNNFKLHYGDMGDTSNLCRLIKEIQPDEVYHLAAMSHVGVSFDIPEYSYDITGVGTLRLLEAIRISSLNPCIYNAGTSELFGGSDSGRLLNEESPFHPKSPYAISKLYSYWMMRLYRDAYGMRIWSGILFNHESPRRGEDFITRKITLSIARILSGKQQYLEVGNINAERDWGYAPDYVEAMWMMLQSRKPDDFVIATGEVHSVKEFIEKSCYIADLSFDDVVRVNPLFLRPVDVSCLCGDASKAKRVLGWEPKVCFDDLIGIMMKADMER